LIQIGHADHQYFSDLQLGDRFVKRVESIKYLGIWLIEGKCFKVDCNMNTTKFLGAVFGILQKCSHVSEELVWNIINQCCLPILLYGIDTFCSYANQVHELSVALNTAVRRCFNIARNVSVRNLLYFLGSMHVQKMNVRRVKLLKSCLNSCDVLRICALVRVSDDSFHFVCYKYMMYIVTCRCAT
jgi:hypothetical protein